MKLIKEEKVLILPEKPATIDFSPINAIDFMLEISAYINISPGKKIQRSLTIEIGGDSDSSTRSVDLVDSITQVKIDNRDPNISYEDDVVNHVIIGSKEEINLSLKIFQEEN